MRDNGDILPPLGTRLIPGDMVTLLFSARAPLLLARDKGRASPAAAAMADEEATFAPMPATLPLLPGSSSRDSHT